MIPYSVTIHIAEKNCNADQLKRFTSILQGNHNFDLIGSSFSSGHNHEGTTLVKSISGENAITVFEGVKNELSEIETGTTVRFNCQLTVAATDVITDVIFIN